MDKDNDVSDKDNDDDDNVLISTLALSGKSVMAKPIKMVLPPQRPQRLKMLPSHLRSPYIVEMENKLQNVSKKDKVYANLVFAEEQDLQEVLYYNPNTTLKRETLQSMQNGVWLNAGLIDAWAHELNLIVERSTKPKAPRRSVFFSTIHSVST